MSYQEFGSFPSDTINVCLWGLERRELHFSMVSLHMSDLQLNVIANASLKKLILWLSSLGRAAGGLILPCTGNPQSRTQEWEQLLLSHFVAGITHHIIFFPALSPFAFSSPCKGIKNSGKVYLSNPSPCKNLSPALYSGVNSEDSSTLAIYFRPVDSLLAHLWPKWFLNSQVHGSCFGWGPGQEEPH